VPGWEDKILGGPHHMCTTRMAASPRQGVVDADCRVHSVANLYVAGSSVFATGGYANPTFTIVALALRLADRLRAELG
jgi:choline dehydrogenase-like flavoprotein